LLSQIRLSVICNVCGVVEIVSVGSSQWVSGLNARGVAKYSDFGPVEGYISETVQETASDTIND